MNGETRGRFAHEQVWHTIMHVHITSYTINANRRRAHTRIFAEDCLVEWGVVTGLVSLESQPQCSCRAGAHTITIII